MSSPPLCVRGLHLQLGGQSVLQAIDLQLQPGEFTALVGPNGSGKSSLLRCVAGLQRPASGNVEIDGHSPWTARPQALARIGYMVDPVSLPALLSGADCLALFARARGLDAVPTASFELAEALRLSPWLDRPVEEYSLGTRQKLAVLLGLLGEPPLLLLDEPLNGLDPPSALALKQHLAERARAGAAVLLATHAIAMAERHVNRALLLVDGRLRRSWSAAELDALRADPRRSLEQEMVAAMEGAC